MGLLSFFTKRKHQKESELSVREQAVAQKEEKVGQQSEQLQQGTLKVAATNEELVKLTQENTALGKSLDAKGGQIVALVREYDNKNKSLLQKETILLKKEQLLKEDKEDFEERNKSLRIDEIDIAARKADVRRRESEVNKRDEGLEAERKNIKEREAAAKKLSDSARTIKEDMRVKKEKLEEKKRELRDEEEKLAAKSSELAAKESDLEKRIADIQRQEEKFSSKEESLREIQRRLEEKIKEIEVNKATFDNIKFDAGEEGKSAKITVQEAIRKGKNLLQDQVQEFENLQEKYCEGTFKGFSIPVDEIDSKLEELKNYFKQIASHAENYPFMKKLVEEILSHLENAQKNRKSYDFAECYSEICYGLAKSKSYEVLLHIIEDMQGGDSAEGEDNNPSEDEEEPDWYEILGVNEDATEAEIRNAARKKTKECHPDKGGSDEKMAQINKAREILLDTGKRNAYNARRKERKQKG